MEVLIRFWPHTFMSLGCNVRIASSWNMQRLGVVEDIRVMAWESLKDTLASLADKVVLDPAALECWIHYRIGIERRNRVASSRGRDSIPVLCAVSAVPLSSGTTIAESVA